MALGLPLHAAMLWYSEQLAALSHTYRYAFVSSPAFLKRLDLHLTPPRGNDSLCRRYATMAGCRENFHLAEYLAR